MEEQPDKRRGTIGLKLSMCFVLALQAGECSRSVAGSCIIIPRPVLLRSAAVLYKAGSLFQAGCFREMKDERTKLISKARQKEVF